MDDKLIQYENRKRVVLLSEWVRDWKWGLIALEISAVIGDKAIFTSFSELLIVDELGIDISEYTKYSFRYYLKKEEILANISKDEY